MRVTDIDVTESARGTRIAAMVQWEGRRRDADRIELLYRDIGAGVVAAPGDALAATVLMPAMARGEDVSIDAPVSRKLHDGAAEIVDAWTSWRPRWHRARLTADLVDRSDLSPSVVAACFSAGVDSFFTAVRPREEPITTLLTLREFTSSEQLLSMADDDLRIVIRAAQGLGREQIVVESNAYLFCRKYLSRHETFGDVFTGSLLAAAALGLGGLIRRCHISSGYPHGWHMFPTGIHPFVEHWSSEAVEIDFDGADFERAEKVDLIAHNDVVLETLCVCPQLRSTPVPNCRRCDKCQETAFLLMLAGSLDRCRTLGPVTPETLRRTIIMPLRTSAFEQLRTLTDDPVLRRAITSGLRRSRVRRWARPLGRVLRRIGLR